MQVLMDFKAEINLHLSVNFPKQAIVFVLNLQVVVQPSVANLVAESGAENSRQEADYLGHVRVVTDPKRYSIICLMNCVSVRVSTCSYLSDANYLDVSTKQLSLYRDAVANFSPITFVFGVKDIFLREMEEQQTKNFSEPAKKVMQPLTVGLREKVMVCQR